MRDTCLEARCGLALILLAGCNGTPGRFAGTREPPVELAIMDADQATEYYGLEDRLDFDLDDGIKPPDWCSERRAKKGRHFHRDPAHPGWALRYTLGKAVPKSCQNCGVFLDECIAIELGFRTKAVCELVGRDRVCEFFACAKKENDRVLSAPSATCFWTEHNYFDNGGRRAKVGKNGSAPGGTQFPTR